MWQGIAIALHANTQTGRVIVNDDRTHTTEPGLTALLRQLGNDSSALLRSEIDLAKLEAQEMMRAAAADGAKLGAAAAIAGVGGLALVASLILALGHVLGDHYASAAAIVGIVFVGVGAILARRGVKGLKSGALKPDATIQTLQEDKQWAATEVRELKRTLRS